LPGSVSPFFAVSQDYRRLTENELTNFRHDADDGGFDLDNSRDYWMDNILECNAPFFGKIATIRESLACYRFHASNLYLMNRLDPAHFEYALKSSAAKFDYLGGAAENGGFHLIRQRLTTVHPGCSTAVWSLPS
jgi:hypothetical protein